MSSLVLRVATRKLRSYCSSTSQVIPIPRRSSGGTRPASLSLGDCHLPPGGNSDGPPPDSRLRWIVFGLLAAVPSSPFWYPITQHPIPIDHFATAVGERRIVHLSDGSSCMLNTGSQVIMGHFGQVVHIELQKGEVWCDLARNPLRDFAVSVGGIRVRDIGTSFSVRRTGEGVEVTVKEGKVRIESPGLPETSLERNQRARIADHRDHAAVNTLAPEEVVRQLSWQHGQLIFQGETLAAAMSEVNRYNSNVKLALDDPTLAATKVSIVMADATDPVEQFVKPLPKLINHVSWSVDRRPDGTYVYTLRRFD
jgi:ferric-dicitrate binding protein FerR (iron transport regulator)